MRMGIDRKRPVVETTQYSLVGPRTLIVSNPMTRTLPLGDASQSGQFRAHLRPGLGAFHPVCPSPVQIRRDGLSGG